MNRLVLIGNGFDLAHGLKTSYKDFVDWYWKDWGKRLLHGKHKTETDGLCSFKLNEKHNMTCWASVWGWHYRRENPLIPWDEDEVVELAKQDRDLCDFIISPFLERICKSIETKKWVDIENEYYALLVQYVEDDSPETKIDELNNQLHSLQEKLIEYLCEVNEIEVNPKQEIQRAIYSPFNKTDISIEGQQALIEHIESGFKQSDRDWQLKFYHYGKTYYAYYVDDYRKIVEDGKPVDANDAPIESLLPNQIMLLNFNYTKTAQLYCLSQPIFSVNQIHGKVEKPEGVIFGYGDEMDEKYKELENKNDNRCLGNIKSIKYLEADNYRKVLQFIESEPYQIFIMGHSCGNSDRTLLNTLFEHRNCVSIKPYFHQIDKENDNYLDIVQNISRNFTDMKLMRDRVVNKTYCETLTNNKQ